MLVNPNPQGKTGPESDLGAVMWGGEKDEGRWAGKQKKKTGGCAARRLAGRRPEKGKLIFRDGSIGGDEKIHGGKRRMKSSPERKGS